MNRISAGHSSWSTANSESDEDEVRDENNDIETYYDCEETPVNQRWTFFEDTSPQERPSYPRATCQTKRTRGLLEFQSTMYFGTASNSLLGRLSVAWDLSYARKGPNVEYNKYRLRYQYPAWFLMNAIDVDLRSCREYYGSIGMKIIAIPIKPPSDPIFRAIISGDIQLLQRLFTTGEASPVVRDTNGCTLLHVSVLRLSLYILPTLAGSTTLTLFQSMPPVLPM